VFAFAGWNYRFRSELAAAIFRSAPARSRTWIYRLGGASVSVSNRLQSSYSGALGEAAGSPDYARFGTIRLDLGSRISRCGKPASTGTS
jgi:hypothetical protein